MYCFRQQNGYQQLYTSKYLVQSPRGIFFFFFNEHLPGSRLLRPARIFFLSRLGAKVDVLPETVLDPAEKDISSLTFTK